jgi:hypothetical protein
MLCSSALVERVERTWPCRLLALPISAKLLGATRDPHREQLAAVIAVIPAGASRLAVERLHVVQAAAERTADAIGPALTL